MRYLILSSLVLMVGCCEKTDTGLADTADTACEEVVWYPDWDGDGFGCDIPGVTYTQCEAPNEHYVMVSGDSDGCFPSNSQ